MLFLILSTIAPINFGTAGFMNKVTSYQELNPGPLGHEPIVPTTRRPPPSAKIFLLEWLKGSRNKRETCLFQIRVVLLQEGDLQRLHRVERPDRPEVEVRATSENQFLFFR